MEPTVTLTGPGPTGVDAGTTATICVLDQLVTEDAATPLNLTELLPCEEPKFEPVTVTEVPRPPILGDMPVTKGVVPTVTAVLSKVALAEAEVLWFVTTIPINTFCAIVIVWVVAIWVQVTPLGEA